jgi:hypothetical protein
LADKPHYLKTRLRILFIIGAMLPALSTLAQGLVVSAPVDNNGTASNNTAIAYSTAGSTVGITALSTISGNLAYGKTAVGSSYENATAYPASAVTDGATTGARWSSAFTGDQSIYIDLGATYTITGANIYWETAYGKAYSIDVCSTSSFAAGTYTTIYSTTTGDGATDNITPTTSASGRYIRMYGTVRGLASAGFSLYEFQVFGTAAITYSLSTNPSSYFAINSSTGVVTLNSGVVPPGTYTIGITATAGGVTSTSSNFTVTVTAATPTISGSSSGCGAGSVTLTAAGGTPAGGTYNWYNIATGGTAQATGTSYAPNVTGTYYVDYTSGGVTSARSAGKTVTINATPAISAAPPTGGLYLSYPFSTNTTTTTADVSGSNNTGNLVGSPSTTTDRYNLANSAYSFNGTNQYITTTNSSAAPGPTDFSISVWFKTNAADAGGLLVGYGNAQTGASASYDRHIYMSDAGLIYFGIFPGFVKTINTTTSYADGQWHHVVATVSATSGSKLYLDGSLQASDATMTASQNYNAVGYWRIAYDNLGGWTNAPTRQYFKGSLDDIAAYNSSISAAQVYTLYGAGSSPACIGSPLTLQANTVTGATYSWIGPNGYTSTTQNPTVSTTATATMAGTYVLTVTGANGCSSTIDVTAVVNSLPTASFTATSAVDVNANATITLTSTYDATSTYAWDFNGGTPATGTGNGPFTVQWATTGIKTVTLTVTNTSGCSTVFTKTVAVGAASFSGYAFKKQLVLNTTSAGITTDQTSFPALVYIQDNNLIVTNNCNNKVQYPLGNYNGAAGTNYDFAFLDPATSGELNYQVESYNSTTGTLLVWVQIPKLYAATNNTLSFYFGSLTPAHTASFYNSTWGSDYLAVYHFNETSGTVLDATNNAVNGTATNVTAATDKIHTAAGLTGGGYSFSKTSQSKIITTKKADITANAFTLSAWVSVTTPGGDNKVVSNELNFGPGYKLGAKLNAVETETRSTNTIGTEGNLGRGGTVTTGWHYIQGTFNGSAFINYLDGVAVTTSLLKTATSITPLAGDVVTMGIDHRSGVADENYFDGLMDEVRISNVIKSSDWIKAEYVNQTAPLTFTDYSAPVTVNHTNAAAIPGALLYTWTGATSTDPSIAGNWTNTTEGVTSQLPNANASVTIPVPTSSSYPKLTAPLTLYGLTVAASSNIDLNNQVLTIGCNVYNNGRINAAGVTNASTLTWNGTITPQLYIGNTTTSNTAQFGNFTVVNTASSGQVKLSGGPVDIYNTLTLTSGSLVVDNTTGSLTLKSSGTVTARVAAITSATQSITGNVTVERWFTGGALSNRGWRLMSSPVNNTSTLPATASAMFNFTSLKTNLYITGTGTNFDATSGPTILFYNTSTKLFTWPSDPTTTTNKIGSGFYFFFRGNKSSNKLVKTSGGVYPTPESNVVGLQTGVLNQQSFSYALSNAGNRFNQVGNPYPSSILVPSGGGTSTAYTGTTGFVWTYVSNASSVVSHPTAVTIASGQGFFVQSTSATSSINFTESLKTTNQPTGLNLLLGTPVGTQTPMITLKMVQDSANYDITYVRFLDTYKKEFDEMEDAPDLNGQGQNVFFGAITNDNHLVAIASQPIEKQKTSVFLSVNDNYSGIYSIEKIDISGIPAVYDVWLKDHFRNDSLDLRANSVYKFNLDKANPQTYGSTRFEVLISKKSFPPYQLLSFKGKRTTTDVTLNWNTLNEYDYTSFELQRSTDGINFEAVRNIQSSSQGSYTFKDVYVGQAAPKLYYRLKQTDINDNVTYSDIIIISTEGDGTLSLYPNPASNVIQYRLKDDSKATSIRLRIYSVLGVLVKNSTFTSLTGQQDISSLTPGSYTIELTDNNSKKILLTGKFIKL